MILNKVRLNDQIVFGDEQTPFVLLSGPCALEERDRVFRIAEGVKKITDKLGIPYVF
jgi:2-dehydro-3-deoxyphosphooctonate aldolase (KDO 8-P synthase)